MERWDGIRLDLARKGFVDRSDSIYLLGRGTMKGCPTDGSCDGPSHIKLFWSEKDIRNFVVCECCGTVMDLQSMKTAV